MAFYDAALQLSNAQAITSTAASASVYDVTGAGVGNSANIIFGQNGGATVFGADVGVGTGSDMPTVTVTIPTAFTTSNGATLQIQVQASIDDGTNNPSSYVTLWETVPLAASALVANTKIVLPLPPAMPLLGGSVMPRFYRLNYVVGTGVFTGGAVNAWIGLNDAPTTNILYPSNYVVA